MNKEIKFRAWNEKHSNPAERMIYPALLDADGEVLMPDGSAWAIPVMQFTGLKDKNGKEIYEGDILEFTDKWEWYRSSYGIKMNFAQGEELAALKAKYEAEPMHRHTVEFDPIEGYGLSKSDLTNYFAVIGNIYENPELLK